MWVKNAHDFPQGAIQTGMKRTVKDDRSVSYTLVCGR
jgi:hypothetical protein